MVATRVIEVTVSAVPSLCSRRKQEELRFTVFRKDGGTERFVTIRVCGKNPKDAEQAIAFVRDWIDASLTSGALDMEDLAILDRRVILAQGIGQVLPR